MTLYTPQEIFANINRESKWTTETEVKVANYIIENIETISFGMTEAIRCGAQTFDLDILNTIKLES